MPTGSGFDDHVQWYWSTLIDDALQQAYKVLSTPGISSGLLHGHLAEHQERDVKGVTLRCALNPACRPAQLEKWVRTGGPLLASTAAANPSLGGRVTTLYLQQAKKAGLIVGSLIANPGAPAAFVAEFAGRGNNDALSNAACPPEHVHTVLARWGDGQAFRHVGALAHPACLAEILDEAIAAPATWGTRTWVVWSPTATEAQMHTVIAAERDTPSQDAVGVRCDALRRIDELRWERDPFNQPAAELTQRDYRPDIAAALATSTEVASAAMRPLLTAGFAGTVAELFDVAATFR